MDNTQQVGDLGEQQPPKARYVTPEVVDYGNAADLTQSGANRTQQYDGAMHDYVS